MSRARIVWMLFLALLPSAAAAVYFTQQALDAHQSTFVTSSLKYQARVAQQTIKMFGLQQLSAASSSLSDARLSAVFAAQGEDRQKKAEEFLKAPAATEAGQLKPAFSSLADHDGAFLASSGILTKEMTLPTLAKKSAAQDLAVLAGKAYLLVSVPIYGAAAPPPPPAGTQPKEEDKKEDDTPKKAPSKRTEETKKDCPAGRRWACYSICMERKAGKCVKYSKDKKCACYPIRSTKPKKRSSLLPQKRGQLAQAADDDKPTPAAKPAETTAPAAPKLLGFYTQGFLLDDTFAARLKDASFDKDAVIAFFFPQGKVIASSTPKKAQAVNTLLSSADGKPLLAFAKDAVALSLGSQRVHAIVASMLGGKIGLVIFQDAEGWGAAFQQAAIITAALVGGFLLLLLIFLLPAAGRTEAQLFALEKQILDIYRTGNLQVTLNEGQPGAVGSLAASLNRIFFQLRNQVTALQDAALNDLPPVTEQSISLTSPAVQLALNDPDTHYSHVFALYAKAKEQVGEDTSLLDEDRFIEKLRNNAATFQKQYDCLGVAFDVTIKDNKVILKPQLIPRS